jgi:hypothetical protein
VFLIFKGKRDTRVESLIASRKSDTLRLCVAISSDFDVEAVSIVLWPATHDRLWSDVIAMES